MDTSFIRASVSTVANQFSRPKWLAQALSLMVLGTVAAVYFFWYVPRQREYFASRNFRVLALTSDQIQKTIEAFPGVLRIAAQSVESETLPSERAPLQQRVRKAMELIPALMLTTDPTVETFPDIRSQPGTSNRLNGSWLELEYRSYAGTNTNRLVIIQAKCDLSRIALVPQEFDGLLVAQGTGEMVFQRLPVGLSVQKLNSPDKDGPNASGTNLVRSATALMTAPLAGEAYKFFVQPLQLALAMQPTEANNWLVCGLVRAGRFNSESLEVSYFFLILCIFMVLFAVLSLVFPRVGFAGPREPLRRRTVFLLAAGTLGGVAVLTILLLDVMIYPFMGTHFDRASEHLAGMIRANFHKEIKEWHRLIVEFDALRKTSFPGTNVLTQALTRREITDAISNSPVRFDMIFWTGEDGMQTDKWAVRRTATTLIDVRTRAYVQDALEDRNTVRAYRERGANQFWIEPIYSLSTGENSAVLAIRTSNGVAAIEGKLQSLLRPVLPTGHGFCVVTEDGQVLFHSEVRRNLRENLFEECDDSTRLHSAVISRTSQQFNLSYLGRTHNFFVTPIENLPWTLVVFRDRQLLSAANFELVLVSLFLLLLCFVAPLAMGILVLGVPWLLRSAIGRPAPISALLRWLWPDPGRWKVYLGIGVFNLLLALLLVSLVTFLLPDRGSSGWAWYASGCAVAGAAVGVLAAFLLLTRQPSGPPPQGPPRKMYPWFYVTALISLLLLMAVVPAFTSFNIAQDMRVQLFIKHHQFSFAKALTERADRLKREHRQIPGAGDLETRLALNSDRLPWDVYAGNHLGIVPSDEGPTTPLPWKKRKRDHTPFDWIFETITPLRDPVSVATRGLLPKRAEDGFWYWDNFPKKVTLRVNNYRENTSLSLDTPKIAIPNYTWLLTFAATGLILLFPVCFAAHRVFLIHLPRQASAQESLSAESISENLLLLGPVADSERLLDRVHRDVAERRRKDSLEIDCRQKTFDAPASYRERKPYVILDHFEHGWDDAQINRRKLELLDKLTSRFDSRVIISSGCDPRRMRMEEPTEQSGQDGLKSDAQRWTQLWREFRWVPLGASPDEEQAGHRALWDSCSKDEKLALFHVAKHGLLHANNPELPILLGRGLLRNDRGLRLMSPGFHRFVLNTVDPAEVQIYDRQVAGQGWEIARGPVYVALVGVALLMFVTQPEIYKIVFGIITAFAAAPPAILKLMSMFESDKGKKAAA